MCAGVFGVDRGHRRDLFRAGTAPRLVLLKAEQFVGEPNAEADEAGECRSADSLRMTLVCGGPALVQRRIGQECNWKTIASWGTRPTSGSL